MLKLTNLPNDVLNIILEYDGRIKYRNGIYVDVLHKYDERYNIIAPVISKKMVILSNIELDGQSFYFEFAFNIDPIVGLCYDYNFTRPGIFEICYFDLRYSWHQIRTYL